MDITKNPVFTLPEAREMLGNTPRVLNALLGEIGPGWYTASEGPETWRPVDVVGHLIHAEETNWIPRARMIIEHGEDRVFEPFDRFGQFERFEGWPLGDLLDRFAEVRSESLRSLSEWNLDERLLNRRGRHPDFGPVTLQQLLATWTVHDLGHIRQIVRVMARRYEDAVGPWRAYLTILQR